MLLPDGRLKMSGNSPSITREIDWDRVKPGMLPFKAFNLIKFKRGMIHSFVNEDHVFIIEMVDRQYL